MRFVVSVSWWLGVAVLLSTPPARAQAQRYSTTAAGGVAATGNTLGLAKALDNNGPGTESSIGTFITDGTGVDGTPASLGAAWPAGTTSAWADNRSTAVLELPTGATVLHAELIWEGSYAYGGEDVSAALDTAVTFDDGVTAHLVSPNSAAAVTLDQIALGGYSVHYYVRAADVTAVVQTAGAGLYAVGGVPASQHETVNALNAAGWTLLVAYHDPAAPVRRLELLTGGPFVEDGSSPADFAVSGFCTPPTGPVAGTVSLSAIAGDANRTGDAVKVAAAVK